LIDRRCRAASRLRPTGSELSLGGLIKQVTGAEQNWATFIIDVPAAFQGAPFRVIAGETLEDLSSAYADVARQTDELVCSLPDLDVSHPLPAGVPWARQGVRWSARRTLLHIIGETAQHAGHADILRETIDGQKTMG
jgi:hypothetical protein